MRTVSGIGARKLEEFGEIFLQAVAQHCHDTGATQDQKLIRVDSGLEASEKRRAPTISKSAAYSLFERGATIEEVAGQVVRAKSTIAEYLCEFIRESRPESISAWVSSEKMNRIRDAAARVGRERLKPIYLELGESVPYEEIRVALAWLEARE